MLIPLDINIRLSLNIHGGIQLQNLDQKIKDGD